MTLTESPIPNTDPTMPYVLPRDAGEHLHFLNHLATRKVTAGPDGALSAVEFVGPRGFGPPLHSHDHEDEIIVVLDGEIVFRAGGEETIATGGATVFLPHGVPHSFQILSPTARFMSITASRQQAPDFDVFVAELGDATDGPELPEPVEIDPGHVAMVGGRHGIEILGPPPAPLD